MRWPWVFGGSAAQAARFRRRIRLRSASRRFSPSRWMSGATTERPTASSNPSAPRSRTLSSPRCSGLLIVDSTPECFLRAAAKAGSASRSRSAADFPPFFGKAFNSKRSSSVFRFDGLWKPRSKLHPRRFGNAFRQRLTRGAATSGRRGLGAGPRQPSAAKSEMRKYEFMPPASPEGHRTRNQVLTFLIEIAELSAHYFRGPASRRPQARSRERTAGRRRFPPRLRRSRGRS